MANLKLSQSVKLSILLFALSLLFSCRQTSKSIAVNEIASVKGSVYSLVNQTAKDLADKGPVAWLNYFENSPDFFMASDGSLAFADYHTADTFINGTLIKQIKKIDCIFKC